MWDEYESSSGVGGGAGGLMRGIKIPQQDFVLKRRGGGGGGGGGGLMCKGGGGGGRICGTLRYC